MSATSNLPIMPWLERLFLTEPRREGLLALVVDTAVELTGADRGLLVLLEGPAARLHVAAARGYDRQSLEGDDRQAWRTIVSSVLGAGVGLVTTAEQDPGPPGVASARRNHVISILCVPLPLRQGAIYLDHPFMPDAFGSDDLALLERVADLASRALARATD